MGDPEFDRRLELDHGTISAGVVGLGTPEPMVAWLRDQRRSKSQMASPSWLLSLVTHMAVLVVIGSLASKPRAPGHPSPIVITMSLTGGSDQANSSPLATTVVQSEPENEDESTSDPSHRDRIAQGRTAEAVEGFIPDRAAGGPSEEAPRGSLRKPVVRWGRLPESFEIRESSLSAQAPGDRRSAAASHDWQPNWRDEVVERFIQYDVGRLPGAAGSGALHDFQQLGPDAIPALVRGLNRAATMRASCPVGVISSRLNTLLSQADDPRTIRYALENIGRDVNTTAPHYRSIRSLVHRLKRAFGVQAYALPSPAGQRSRKWWMPDQGQASSPAAPVMSKRGQQRWEVGSERKPLSGDPVQRKSSGTRAGWNTLESLLETR